MNKLNTIDGETLMSRPLQPLNFVVDTWFSQGREILAGPVAGGGRCQGRTRLGNAGKAGNDSVPLLGGLPAPHPEPTVRRDGGRTNMGRLTVLRSDELIDRYADLCAAIRRLTKEVR